MRILYYNWVDYEDPERRGGGVSVYQANLMRALMGRDDVEASFLSAGVAYDLPAGPPRWERRNSGSRDRPARYEIVNSGVLAPSHHSFGDPAQLAHPATERVFADFLTRNGPFDIVHFQTLEGLPARVLALRDAFPSTRFVLSLHNYYPLCPQVNLWAEERETCRDNDGGNRCRTCLPHQPSPAMLRMANGLAYRLKRAGFPPGSPLFNLAFRTARFGAALMRRYRRAGGGGTIPVTGPATGLRQRRAAMVDLINRNCDRVLCVSERVGRIARQHGIRPGLLRTSYIGTSHADRYFSTPIRPRIRRDDHMLTLGYLGYMRRDKGFHFLLEALSALPPALARRVRLVCAARQRPDSPMKALDALRSTLGGLDHIDGYTQTELDDILRDVDVGVVPVMWEDNLPQVALEMHARRIPLLTSDLGGAREVARCADMVFRAGDSQSLCDRIAWLLSDRLRVSDYWRNAMPPVSMDAHLAELMSVYAACGAASSDLPLPMAS